MVSRRGAAHLEMVVSFVFFISFVSFLFLVLKPYDTSLLTGNVVTGIEESFIQQAQTNYSKFFLRTSNVGGTSCFKLSLPDGNFRYALSDSNVRDLKFDSIVKSRQGSGSLEIEGNVESERSFTVLISPEFTDNLTGSCVVLGSKDYDLGSIFEKRMISFKQLTAMKTQYDTDYESLKSRLRIPEVFDFTITSQELPSLNMVRSIPGSVDVTVTEVIHEVLNETGGITNVRFVFKVW